MGIDRQIQSIGKRTFVNCFEKARKLGRDIMESEVKACDYPGSKKWKQSSLSEKTSKIRAVFRDGNECKVLKKCCTNRMDYESAKKAKELYKRFCSVKK